MIPASVLCIQGTEIQLVNQIAEVFGVSRVAVALVEEPVVEDVEEAGDLYRVEYTAMLCNEYLEG
jgi:hypothetical protein